jgi:hypothetical protein
MNSYKGLVVKCIDETMVAGRFLKGNRYTIQDFIAMGPPTRIQMNSTPNTYIIRDEDGRLALFGIEPMKKYFCVVD